jgi:hypothetical protein
VLHARGQTGKERTQVKVGIPGDKPHGDSLSYPAQTKWLLLPTEWTEFELDLSKYKESTLQGMANGFTFVLSRGQQDNPGAGTT